MPGRYAEAHANMQGPGDARPTGLQIIQDEGLIDKMKDKVFFVTGASSGIGIETGRALAATGGKVFLGVRDLQKGSSACKSYLEPGRVTLIQLDLSSLSSVRQAASTFLSQSSQLNVLVNNAGVMATPYGKTTDGFETQFGTNHLGHFLLFQLLKPSLIKSSTPTFHSRVINVSSSGHHNLTINFPDLDFSLGKPYPYDPWLGYGQSKTANIWMANHIETLYGSSPQGLHGLSLHPGGIWTGLQKFVSDDKMKEWKSIPDVDKLVKSEEQGAATTVFAAVSKELEGVGRVYLSNCEVQGEGKGEGYAKHAFDEEGERRLWDISLELVGEGGK